MAKEAGFIELGDGGRLAWFEAGEGPAVLLIHGGSTDSRMWDAQVDALQADYRVLRYDFRGIGESSRPTARHRMSDDALAVLEERGVETAAVIGFSVGSAVALDLAARVPERVAALAVVGTVPWNDVDAERFTDARRELHRSLEPREQAQRRGDLAAAVGHDLDVWAAAHHGEAREALAAMCMRATYFYEHRESDDEWLWDLPPVPDEALAALPAPGLVVAGDQDVELVRLASDRLAGVLSDGRLLRVADADHFVGLAQTELFNAALLDFLGARRARGAW
jgi:pimeloyl-ACP methyl ester carboxylesterase